MHLEEPESLRKLLENGDPVIFAHWHGDETVLLSLIGKYRIATITSTSKDGEMMTTVVHLMGGSTTRGSSTRGGVNALKGLIRLVRDKKRNSSFAVDGPKGPIYQVKPGVFEISRLLQAPIFPGGVACDRKWVFEKAWNKTFLPKPFARISIVWREPFQTIRRDQDPRDLALGLALGEAIHGARQDALKKIATPGSLG